MTRDPSDPPRLVEDPSGGGRLGDLIRASRHDVASAEEMKLLEARLAPLLWPGTAAPGGDVAGPGQGPGAATGAGASGIGKIVGAVAIVVAAGGAGYWLSRDPPPPPPVERVSEPPAMVPTEPAEEAIPSRTPVPEPAVEKEEVQAAPEPKAPTKPTAASPPRTALPKAATAPKPPPTEAELLEAARRSLESNPKHALSLVREHERRYPNGMLAQEREVLEIAALKNLGRERAAEQKAEDFKKEFPGSAHQRKVDGVVRER